MATLKSIIDPKSPDYEATRARALVAAGRPDEAMDAAMKALSMRPTDKELWLLRMEVQDAQRAAAAARAAPSKAPPEGPGSSSPSRPGGSPKSAPTPGTKP